MRMASGIGALLFGAGVVTAAFAQEASEPNILLKMTEPAPAVPARTITRDDVREVPTPRVDRLSDHARATVVVGDPRCLPGEEGWFDPGLANSRTSRSRRAR